MTITRINHFEAAEGQAEALRDFLKSVVATVKSAAGCQGCQLLRDPEEPRRLAIIEVWDSIAAHRAAAAVIPPERIAQVMPLLAGKPTGRYYEAVI